MSAFKHLSPQEQPAYRGSEAAHILSLPYGTVMAWSFGQAYLHRDGSPKRFVPLIKPADGSARLLSFVNLCELHVLSSIRRRHRVSMPGVRKAIAYVERQLGIDRPLASSRFSTNGMDLFVNHADVLLNASQDGQQALRDEFERALQRIDFAKNGSPVVLFPFTRPSGEAAQPRTVLIDPRRSFGRPVLADAYVRTEVIESRFQAGDSIADIAKDYGVERTAVEEALRFESRRAA
jgi:uncharacterized protein (DUF433 family)